MKQKLSAIKSGFWRISEYIFWNWEMAKVQWTRTKIVQKLKNDQLMEQVEVVQVRKTMKKDEHLIVDEALHLWHKYVMAKLPCFKFTVPVSGGKNTLVFES